MDISGSCQRLPSGALPTLLLRGSTLLMGLEDANPWEMNGAAVLTVSDSRFLAAGH